MSKELVTVEFRYSYVDLNDEEQYVNKKITIGIFDRLKDAVYKGNMVLYELSKTFEVRAKDKFKVKGLLGCPDRLVTNCCYPTKGIAYFAQITKLNFESIGSTINGILEHKGVVI